MKFSGDLRRGTVCAAGAVLLCAVLLVSLLGPAFSRRANPETRAAEPAAAKTETPAPKSAAPETAEDAVYTERGDAVLLDAPCRSQLPDYPTGCEAVSAAMLCDFFNVPFDLAEFVSAFLPMEETPHEEGGALVGGDMWEAFLGDPRREDGWGCYSTALAPALSAYIEGSGYRAEAVVGRELSEIVQKTLDHGEPVLIWGTLGMQEGTVRHVWTVRGTNETRAWIYPMHCLLLVGYDRESYFFNDPMEGETVSYPKKDTEDAYAALSKQALRLVPAD